MKGVTISFASSRARSALYLYTVICLLPSRSIAPPALVVESACYTGNGTVSSDLPCNPSQDISFCCGIGWSCLSNGLCQYRESTSFAEGTCTDKTFPTNHCLASCLASGNEAQTLVHNCGGAGDGDENSWCCAGVQGTTGQGQDCCSTNDTTTLGSYPYSTITVITASSTTSTTTSPSSSSTTTSSASSSLTAAAFSAKPTTTNPTSSSSTSSVPTSNSTPTIAPHAANAHSIALGAGLGIPLGILSFAILATLIYRDRRSKELIRDLQGRVSGAGVPFDQELPEPKTPMVNAAEMPAGLDRGELSTGLELHELSVGQRYEVQ